MLLHLASVCLTCLTLGFLLPETGGLSNAEIKALYESKQEDVRKCKQLENEEDTKELMV